jgi:hypothetical protein
MQRIKGPLTSKSPLDLVRIHTPFNVTQGKKNLPIKNDENEKKLQHVSVALRLIDPVFQHTKRQI